MSILERKEAVSERLNEMLLREVRAIIVSSLEDVARDVASVLERREWRGQIEGRDRALLFVCLQKILSHAGRLPTMSQPMCCQTCAHWNGGLASNSALGYCLAYLSTPEHSTPPVEAWSCCEEWEEK